MKPENEATIPSEENTLGMTPAELIRYHIEHPNEPVTGEEIANAKISDDVADEPAKNTADTDAAIQKEEQEKEDRSFAITTPYDVLGG